MTAVVEAVVLIAFVFVMGLIFGFLVAMIFGRNGGGPGPRGAAGVPRPADRRPDPKVTGSGPGRPARSRSQCPPIGGYGESYIPFIPTTYTFGTSWFDLTSTGTMATSTKCWDSWNSRSRPNEPSSLV